MRRLASDLLACLLVLGLAVTGFGLGRHAAAAHPAGWTICGAGGAHPSTPDAHGSCCPDCLMPALAAPAALTVPAPEVASAVTVAPGARMIPPRAPGAPAIRAPPAAA
jgi:hypothetical protein